MLSPGLRAGVRMGAEVRVGTGTEGWVTYGARG